MRVYVKCECGHDRKWHDEVVKCGESKNSKLGSRAKYPYSDRYKHRCRFCDCNKFVLPKTMEKKNE